MIIGQDTLSIIEALHDPVLLVSQRGKIVNANGVFFQNWELTESDLADAQLIDLYSNKVIKRGLFRLFIKALRGQRDASFTFPHRNPDKMVKNVLATACRAAFGDQEHVVFTFKEIPTQKVVIADDEGTSSWKAYFDLAYEPYVEFRPAEPISPFQESGDRASYLEIAGDSLQVNFANKAAAKFYKGEAGSLIGESFSSFFNDKIDAIRFLDMLAVVGQIKAETTVIACGKPAQVEMHCMVKFSESGAIDAIYCAQRDLTGRQRYEAIIGDSRIEMDFIFNQPFAGFAFLAPASPIERPQADNVDKILDTMLNEIVIMRVNQAMLDIYGTDRARFLLKSMKALFADPDIARQVLKELFVIRATSVERYAVSEEMIENLLERASTYQALFDSADRLCGVFVATSKHPLGYKPRHSNKTECVALRGNRTT
ncbi:MAG: PAS domain-containing protein [Synergistaceae bacterium]|jgi:PAS domain-containing protein|nr:PAS domain-containing protein [Synergistaceae bacterium]